MDFAALQHSVFLQALGSTILNSLWQVFILWALYEATCMIYKNASAKFKNNFSTVLLFISFIFFVTDLILNVVTHQTPVASAAVIIDSTELHIAADTSALSRFLSHASSSLPYLSVAYIFLLLFLMAKLLAAYRYVYIISNKRLLNAPVQLKVFANKVSLQMGISRKISVWISNHIDVPATIGFIKPIILIPFASINNLSEEQLEAIILHELSHIKRNDYLVNIIIAVIETILFFNPFVVLLSKVIKRERENCCDDFVLQYRYDPHSYASALLRLEQSRVSNLKLAIGAVSGKKQLLSRIKRITTGNTVPRQFNYGQKLLALIIITVIICSVAWISPGNKNNTTTHKVSKEANLNKIVQTKFSDAVVNVFSNQKENLQLKILKHFLPKKENVAIPDMNTWSFPVERKSDFNIDTSIWNQQTLRSAMNMKEPPFFMDESKLQLQPTVDTKNFPFQMDYNLALSKLNIDALNKNLMQAYKEINTVNWTEVQEDVQNSLSKINIADEIQKDKAGLVIETAKAFSELKKLQLKLAPVIRETINKKIYFIQDSINNKLQLQYRMSQHYDDSLKNDATNSSVSEDDNTNLETLINTKSSLAPLHHKSINIKIRQTQKNHMGNFSKNVFELTFDDGAPKPGNNKVITVELNDTP